MDSEYVLIKDKDLTAEQLQKLACGWSTVPFLRFYAYVLLLNTVFQQLTKQQLCTALLN